MSDQVRAGCIAAHASQGGQRLEAALRQMRRQERGAGTKERRPFGHRWASLVGLVIFGALLGGCGSVPRVAPSAGSSEAEPESRLTLEQVSGRGDRVRFTTSLERIGWAPDGVHLTRGKKWVHPLTGDVRDPEPSAEASESTSEHPSRKELSEELAETFDLTDEKDGRSNRRRRWSKSGDVTLSKEPDGTLYVYHLGKGWIKLLEGPTTGAELSPDGRWVAYVREHDLFIVSTETGAVKRISDDGSPDLLYGRLDWVYQEEIYGRGNWKGFWWSPDSSRIAFLRLDESAVPAYDIVDHLPFRPKVETTRYPKAGDPNPVAGLGIAKTDGTVVWTDLSAYPEDRLIVRVGWRAATTAEGADRLLVQVQDRIQTWLDLSEIDVESGVVTKMIHEESNAWVNVIAEPFWLEDGSFLWLSERTGFRHLYHYDSSGALRAPLTKGDWSVRRIMRVDEERKRVWVVGSDRAIESHTYRVPLGGGDAFRVTVGSGTHRVSLNETGTLLLDRFSSVGEPPRIRLVDDQGMVLRELAASELAYEESFSVPELHVVKARDGKPLDAMVVLPHEFDPSLRYPVWVTTYSGPASPSVRNRWQASGLDQFFAQEGYIVLRVNVRSASGRSRADTAECYQQLGVSELSDLEDAVRWLCANPWADGERVGLTGWSYGGFMTAYALTHSDLFRLGVAGAGVYDWRCYDTIYTERYMNTPEANPEGYTQTSCVEAAENLEGHLVLVHGTLDDNVHLQNCMQFVYALQKAGKHFDLMVYPKSRHSVRDSDLRWHLRQLNWRAMQEHLGGGPRKVSGSTMSLR